ncbi:MAG: hypothetical protein IKY62_02435 [Clostridia bacterium]|nr:hypothetical protein [Clostridia bacterium]
MANKSITKQFNEIPFLFRLILQLVFGLLVSGIYRIIRFTETGNILTLVAGIVGLFTLVGNAIFWLVDLVTLIMNDKYTVLAD